MTFLFSIKEISLPIFNNVSRFPVRRIYCVGRNYIEHIQEMGGSVRDEPFFFQKPTDAIMQNGSEFPYPSISKNVHHEIELVVAIYKSATNISEKKALSCVFGYGVGIDMTRRDLQHKAKEMRRPWEVGKAFDCAAPCSEIKPVSVVGHPQKGQIWLSVNGEVRQNGDLSQQIWSVAESIAYLSTLFEIVPGDIIFTGTPAGVGPIEKGDKIEGGVEHIGKISLSVI